MEFIHERDRIYLQNADGKLLAEITFPIQDGVADINHTFVDDSLRGNHISGLLVRSAVEQLTSAGYQVRATCPCASKWLSAHPDAVKIAR